MKLEIKIDKIVDGVERRDYELEERVKGSIGDIRTFVQNIVDLVYQSLDGEVKRADYIGVRIFSSDTPKRGFALKPFRSSGDFPSIIIGFTGDLIDFQETIVHELLHYLGWDEYILERKTKEITEGQLELPNLYE